MGNPITPMDSTYRPIVTNPMGAMTTSGITPIMGTTPMGTHHNIYNVTHGTMQASGRSVYPHGPTSMLNFQNLTEGSSGHVKSRDRYREKQYGGKFQSGGTVDPPLRFLGRSWKENPAS